MSRTVRMVARAVDRRGPTVGGLTLLSLALLGLVAVAAESATGAPQAGAEDIVATDPDRARELERRLITTEPRQLTMAGVRAGEGYFSPDGRWLVYQSEQLSENPFYQIFLLNLQDGKTRQISPGVGKTTCAWIHPSLERVLFASTHDDPEAEKRQREEIAFRQSGAARRYVWDYDEHFELYAFDLKSEQYTRLTHEVGYDAEGSYSPDGRLIAFASNRRGYDGSMTEEESKIFANDLSYMMDIYLMNADGTEVRRLTDTPGYDGGPFFSPDGQRICWRRFSENGLTAEIMTMNIDGSDPRQLTRLNAASWAPFYHPSGKYLIFTTNLHGFGNFELYLVAPDGGTPVRVTYTAGFDGLPVFSPDGTQLYWTRQVVGPSISGRSPAQIFRGDWNHAAALTALGLSDDSAGMDEPSAAEAVAAAKAASADFTPEDVARHVAYLCRPELEGRMTGSRGEQMATAYVATYLDHLGLKPAGGDGGWYEPFQFPAGAELGADNRLAARGDGTEEQVFRLDEEWRPLAFSSSAAFDAAPIVVAGYGITAPSADGQPAYDSFAGLDVRDKWALVFRYIPEEISAEQRQHLAAYATLRDKARRARDLGARGLIVVSGPTSRVREQLVPLQKDAALAGTRIAVVSVTDAVARRWCQAAGRDLGEWQTQLDRGTPGEGFEVPVQLSASIDVRQVQQTGRNALGRFQVGSEPTDDYIVVGAHVDHLGTGTSSSLAAEDERGQIHFGADDNASGVAAMLEIAEFFATLPAEERGVLRRDIVFAAWSGEELNLQGSRYFVQRRSESSGAGGAAPHGVSIARHPQLSAYLNLDMVGRFNGSLVLQGLGSSDVWKPEIQRLAIIADLPVRLIDDTSLPTDSTSFYLAGVPILSAFTGGHSDYHTPRDTPDKLDYDSAARIARFLGLMTRELAARERGPDYIQQAAAPAPSARSFRVYLGTIPDYAAEAKGLLISGATPGSPAAKAGLQKGDVVVELAGKAIENIYDYTAALEALKVGQPTKIAVLRGGQRVEMEIVPGSRE